MELLYVEAARRVKLRLEHKHLHMQPPNCRPVPGWLLYTPNSYSSLTSRGDSYVNFITQCLLRGSVRVIGEGKIPASVVEEVAKLTWLAVLLTFSMFYLNICMCVCRQREFGRKRTTSDFYLKRTVPVSVFIRCHLSQTRLSIRLL